jgi:hydroxylamine reductase (hybrid-cluster protein)
MGRALHGAIKRLGAIGRGRVIAAGLLCHCEDLIFGKPEIVTPALDVLACWPALPPAGHNACGIDAQRCEQLIKKIIKIGLARSCVLLLLY